MNGKATLPSRSGTAELEDLEDLVQQFEAIGDAYEKSNENRSIEKAIDEQIADKEIV